VTTTTRSHALPLIRNRYFFIADVLLMPLAVVVSFLLRLEPFGLRQYARTITVFATLAATIKPPIFFLFGLYRRYWRYASIRELLDLALAAMTGTAVVTVLTYSLASIFVDFPPLPRSIPFLDWLVSLPLLGGPRFAVRLAAQAYLLRRGNNEQLESGQRGERRVLVMGAGDAGALIVREMQANPHLDLVPIGLLDDNLSKIGMTIHGVPVRGTRHDIPYLVKKERIDVVVIAMPSAPGTTIRDVVNICQTVGVECKTVPGIHELVSGREIVKQVRKAHIEDLLRRDPAEIFDAQEYDYLKRATVLVTGAGGSIGVELCRQILAHDPQKLLLLGHGETSIHRALHSLQERCPQIELKPIIADIRDPEGVKVLLALHRPDVIFHAAAHKHVGLMESNVAEAIKNNVLGTMRLLEAAELNDVDRFVLVSTDKAVNPMSVMGATKRVAELLVQNSAGRTKRAYVVVRFGNVLGSRGSVVPLFQGQIAAGGPIKITHPEMTRFFMTIPEAVQLVISAAALGQGGEIFVLEMGEPVNIADLAKELIRLSGLEPGRDMEIVFTKPHPGEKLSEELFGAEEIPKATKHKRILMAYGNNLWDNKTLSRHIHELEALAEAGEPEPIVAKLQEIVPTYRPPSESLRLTSVSEERTSES
jgi:FlaA1/EpsC-like NDP-sugar epimerase